MRRIKAVDCDHHLPTVLSLMWKKGTPVCRYCGSGLESLTPKKWKIFTEIWRNISIFVATFIYFCILPLLREYKWAYVVFMITGFAILFLVIETLGVEIFLRLNVVRFYEKEVDNTPWYNKTDG